MDRIKRVSKFFRIFFQIALLATPLIFIYSWITGPGPIFFAGGVINANSLPAAYTNQILHPLSGTEKLLGALVGAIPLCIILYIIYSLVRLFKLYEQGEIFSLENVRYIRNIGYGLLLTQFVNPIHEFLMGVILTMRNPPGHRFASVTLDQTNISIILTALLVILISWVMAEGCKLREEQQLTI